MYDHMFLRIFSFILPLVAVLGLCACAAGPGPGPVSSVSVDSAPAPDAVGVFAAPAGESAGINFPVEELREENSCYQVNLSYPYTAQEHVDRQVEQYVRALYSSSVAGFKADCARRREADEPDRPSELILDYSSYSSSPEIISILFAPWMYSGGAHGLDWLDSLNFSLSSGLVLDYGDIFGDLSGFYEFLSVYARQSLRPKLGVLWDASPSFMDGLEPRAENFSCFVLKPGGLGLYFPTYQVAPYVDGPQECFVPLELLLPFKPRPGIWQ